MVRRTSDPGQPQRGVGPVADVEGDAHRGERLDGRRLGQASRRRGAAAPRSARPGPWWPRWPPDGPSTPARRPPAPTSRSCISEAGRWWKAAATIAAGQRRLHGGGHRAPGRDQGQHLAALLDQRVGHGDDHLAAERLGQRPDRRHRAPPMGWPPPPPRRRRPRRCRRRPPGTRTVRPSLVQLVGRHLGARPCRATRWSPSPRLAARRAARPRPAGPVPPRIPTCMAITFPHGHGHPVSRAAQPAPG